MTSEEAIVWLESVKASEAATAGQAWQMDLCDTAIGLEKRVQALRMAIKRLTPTAFVLGGDWKDLWVDGRQPLKEKPNPFYPKD